MKYIYPILILVWLFLLTAYIFTNPFARVGYDTRSIFKRSLTGLNLEFFFSKTSCHTKAEEPSLPYYLPIAGGRIIGFIPFPRVLVLCEMQSAYQSLKYFVLNSTISDILIQYEWFKYICLFASIPI